MSEDIYYTYGIINVITKRMYLGSRHCITEEPKTDIGHKYFSSSKDKEFIKEQKEHPENFRYRVLRIFDNPTDVLKHEMWLHERFDVGKNPKFYNKKKQNNCITSQYCYWKGKTIPQHMRDQISETLKGRYVGKLNPFYGKRHTDETKRKISESNTGNVCYWKGKHLPQYVIDKIKETKRKNPYKMPEERRQEIKEMMKGNQYRKGSKMSEELKQKLIKIVSNSMWIKNEELHISKYHPKDEPIPEGWVRGRYLVRKNKRKNIKE